MSDEMKVEIDFEAQIANFVQGTERLDKRLDEVGKKLEHTGKSGEGMFGKMVGAELLASGLEKAGELAVEGAHHIAEMVEQTMEEVEQTHHLAESIGVATSSLQSLQAAGKLGAGLDPQAINTAVEHMSSKLGEAATKGGESADALKRIGLDAKALAQLTPDEAFRAIAGKLGETESAYERAAIAKEIFGKAAGPQIALMAEHLEENEAMARKFGVAMSEAAVEKVGKAKQSMDEFGLASKGAWNQFTVAIAPAVEALGHFLSRGAQAIAGVSATEAAALQVEQRLQAWHASMQAADAATAAEAAQASEEIGKAYQEAQKAVETVGMTDAAKKVYEVRQKFGDLTGEVQQTAEAVEALSAEFKELEKHKKQVEDLERLMKDLRKEIASAGLKEAGEKKVIELQIDAKDLDAQIQKAIGQVENLKREAATAAAFTSREPIADIEAHIKELEHVKTLMEDAVKAGGTSAIDDPYGKLRDIESRLSDAQGDLSRTKAADFAQSDAAAAGKKLQALFDQRAGIDAVIAKQKEANSVAEHFKVNDMLDQLQDAASSLNEVDKVVTKLQKLHATDDEIAEAQNSLGAAAEHKADAALRKMAAASSALSEVEKKLEEFKNENPLATGKQIGLAKEYIETADALEKIKHLTESAKSPTEKWVEDMRTMNDLLHDAKITQDQYAHAKLAADKEFLKAEAELHKQDDKQAAALTRRFNFDLPSNQHEDKPDLPKDPGASPDRVIGDGLKKIGDGFASGIKLASNSEQNLSDIADGIKKMADNVTQTIGSF
jgi:hypothetical protein